jgi:FixJ family two-component response regulator
MMAAFCSERLVIWRSETVPDIGDQWRSSSEMRAVSETLPENNKQVFVIDDDAEVCSSLTSLFRSVGLPAMAFGSTAEFLNASKADVPSCLVLDVRLTGASGLDFQAELAEANMPLPIIFITGYGDIPMTVRAMKAGAVEFLTKPLREQDLLDAVGRGLERARARRDRDKVLTKLQSVYQNLTRREQEVFPLVTSGLMNKQIAGKLGISEITIKVHRGNVMRKMGAKSHAELVRMSDALGLAQHRR